MEGKFDQIRFERIPIIIKISSPSQKIEYKINRPEPYVVLKFNVEINFFHLKPNKIVFDRKSGWLPFYYATIIILLLKKVF